MGAIVPYFLKTNKERSSSLGLWTVEEKYEMNQAIKNQRIAAEFVAAYVYYGGNNFIHILVL